MQGKIWVTLGAAVGLATSCVFYHADANSAQAAVAEAETSQIDACSLLQPAEISKALALPVNAGVRRDAGLESTGAYSSSCVWTIERGTADAVDPDKPLGGRSFVILNAMQWPRGSGDAKKFLEAFHAAAANGDIPNQPSVRRFGDEALWWGDGLAVRKRDVSFGLSVFMPGAIQERRGSYEEQLAPHVLRRLDEREVIVSGARRK
jgi:hypothetical protein